VLRPTCVYPYLCFNNFCVREKSYGFLYPLGLCCQVCKSRYFIMKWLIFYTRDTSLIVWDQHFKDLHHHKTWQPWKTVKKPVLLFEVRFPNQSFEVLGAAYTPCSFVIVEYVIKTRNTQRNNRRNCSFALFSRIGAPDIRIKTPVLHLYSKWVLRVSYELLHWPLCSFVNIFPAENKPGKTDCRMPPTFILIYFW
jgi:ABC-type long-subunit fatty acid transport system fused permease/ATPase subunit